MTQHPRILRTIIYNDEIIPFYKTENGNVILLTNKRTESDEDAIYNLIQSQTPTKNKNNHKTPVKRR